MIVEQSYSNDKIIIFSFYKKPLQRLKEIFPDNSVLRIGSYTEKENDTEIEKFKLPNNEGGKKNPAHYNKKIWDRRKS